MQGAMKKHIKYYDTHNHLKRVAKRADLVVPQLTPKYNHTNIINANCESLSVCLFAETAERNEKDKFIHLYSYKLLLFIVIIIITVFLNRGAQLLRE